MSYIIQQKDLDIIKQANREIFIRLEIMDLGFKVIDQLEGDLIHDNYSIDAGSDIRRTYSCELVVTNGSYLVGPDKKIWLDKYIRPYVGIKHQRSQEIVWYLMGTYTLLSSSYSYNETTKQLSLTCSDLMCTLNDERNGQMEGLTVNIPEGSNARSVIVDLLKDAKITKYLIMDLTETIPYDLDFQAGVTYYDIIKTIITLYSGYEVFFDINGVFTIQSIPTLSSDEYILDDSIFQDIVIEESNHISFTEMYNHIQVWGKQLEADRHFEICTYDASDSTYYAEASDLTQLDNFTTYAVKLPAANTPNPKLKLGTTTALPVTDDSGNTLKSNVLSAGTHVFKYRKADENFYYLGQYQVFAESKDTNPDSKYNPDNLGFTVKKILQGGEYDYIYSNSLAQARADYELYLATRLQDGTELTMISIPWLDVNWKVQYTSLQTKETKQYIIKSISGSSGEAAMTCSFITFYPEYPEIIKKG